MVASIEAENIWADTTTINNIKNQLDGKNAASAAIAMLTPNLANIGEYIKNVFSFVIIKSETKNLPIGFIMRSNFL